MHDLNWIRSNPVTFVAAMNRRGITVEPNRVIDLDRARRNIITELETDQAKRNALSREIGPAKRAGEDVSEREQDARNLKARIAQWELSAAKANGDLSELLESLPNILDPEVPDGPDESANVVLKQVGEPPALPFPPREHFELGEALGMMDFATAAKIAGSRFTILRGKLARLERALGQFMIDLHTDGHGYTETSVPVLVNKAALFGTGQLPKFKDDQFQTIDGRWLIPTAEVSLTNMVSGEILPEAKLPIRVTALTECFRSEAGSAGRDTRGMLRQHQFKKVELVSITSPQDSDAEHERMTRCAETVLEKLNLPYRRVLLCAGDTGFGSARTHDLEVWLPGQGAWREISSCSNMRAFQARRMDARFRAADGKTIAHVHTLNGSGVAVGRALIAIMENYQTADGAIDVPAVLQPYMGGVGRLAG